MSDVSLPNNLEEFYQKGLAALEKNNFDYAIELLFQVVQEEPLHAPSRKALRLAERSKLEETPLPKLSMALLKLNSLLPLIMALIYESLKKYKTALAFYEEVLKYFPDDVSVLKKIAAIAVKQDWLEVAILAHEDMLEANPNNVDCTKKLGYFYKNLGDVAKSKKYFKKVLELLPNDQDIKKDLKDLEALSTISDGHWDDNESYRTKIKNEEQAIVSERDGEQEETPKDVPLSDEEKLISLEKEVKSYPNDLKLRFDLGTLLFKSGNHEAAITQFQLSVKDPAKVIPSLNKLGLCFKEKKMYDLAVVQFQKALEKDSSITDATKEIIYNLGETFELLGKKEEGFEQYKKIYEVDIAYRDVSKKIDRYYGKG